MMNNSSPVLSRASVVNALSQFQNEWSDAAGEVSLLDVQASVGLVLADLVNLLGLTPSERKEVLGMELNDLLTSCFSSVRNP